MNPAHSKGQRRTVMFTSRVRTPSGELQESQDRTQGGKKENATWKLIVVTKLLRERSNFPGPGVQRSKTVHPAHCLPQVSPGVAGGPGRDSLVPAASPGGRRGCSPSGRRLSKGRPGKCQVLSWGFRQKSLLMIMAFRGDATACLASERRRRRQVLHL